jgi:superoxide dismutase, Cu-Zn family
MNIMKKATFLAAALCIGAAPGFAQENRTATAEFINAAGQTIGTAALRDSREGVLIELEVSGLPAGEWLGFHAHETGECDPEDDFESAGDHFDPGEREHGYFVEGGPHAGDMPNQHVGTDGVIRAHVFNSFVRLGEGEADLLGRSLVIHAEPDDYESQPTGDAGARLACAVVE